jgi:hypothetical protein
MLQQHANLDESGFDKVGKRLALLASFFRRRIGTESQGAEVPIDTAEDRIPEPVLVALASLYEIYGPEWRSYLQPTGGGSLEAAVTFATTQSSWPPNNSDLTTFEKMLKGIRLTDGY